MKYEAVFGDQSLFDGCYDENVSIVIATSNGRKFGIGEFTEYGIVEGDVKSDGLRIAMRRIIAEPKRWTVEDKKAGRLPEVGAMSIGKRTKLEYEVVAVTEKQIIMKCTDGMCSMYGHDVFIAFFEPIETPDEKEQREEDEFYLDVKNEWNLAMSNKDESFELGVRATYRKLKGGE